jgi:hypothetical protein
MKTLIELLAARGPMSEETKKKISEALKKSGGAQKAAVNSIGGIMEQEYNSLEKGVAGLKDEYGKLPSSDDVNAQFPIKKNPPKASKAQKAAIKAENDKAREKRKEAKDKIKMRKEQIKNEVKAKRESQKKLRETAQAMKRVKAAEQKIEKAKLKFEKAGKVGDKIKAAALKAKTPEQKQRVKDMEDRLGEQKTKIDQHIAEQQKIISSNGAAQAKTSVFEFSENCEKLSELVFSRKLTKPEERVAFTELNDEFDQLESEIDSEITEIFTPEIERVSSQVEKIVKAGNMVIAAGMGLYIYGNLKNVLKEKYIEAYEYGKKAAAKELGVRAPETPLIQTQWINGEADRAATAIMEELDREVQQKTQYGIVKGLAASAVAAAVIQVIKEKSTKFSKEVAGNLVGDAINEGRRLTTKTNQSELIAFQRSEILDSRTCDFCREMDGKAVKIDDPMADVGQFHTNCRGIWIPIQDGDDPVAFGIPAKYEKAVRPMFKGVVPVKNNIFKAINPNYKSRGESARQKFKRETPRSF